MLTAGVLHSVTQPITLSVTLRVLDVKTDKTSMRQNTLKKKKIIVSIHYEHEGKGNLYREILKTIELSKSSALRSILFTVLLGRRCMLS